MANKKLKKTKFKSHENKSKKRYKETDLTHAKSGEEALTLHGRLMRAMVDEEADSTCEELLVADGLDAAIIGVTCGYSTTIVVYDYNKCIEIFMSEGMTEEEAYEHMSFNVTGAYVGEHTPTFIKLF